MENQEMNQEDREFWESVLELTGTQNWKTFLEEVEKFRLGLEDRMIKSDHWDDFLETRGQYWAYNHILNLRDQAKNMLGLEDNEE